MNKKAVLQVLGLALVTNFIIGCASTSESKSTTQVTNSQENITKVTGNIPAESKFAKVKVGMSMGQVYDTIGQPTDTLSYITGKSFIPFYFGSDAARVEALYKGEGRIVFTGGTGFGARVFKVYKVTYNPSEPGYNM